MAKPRNPQAASVEPSEPSAHGADPRVEVHPGQVITYHAPSGDDLPGIVGKVHREPRDVVDAIIYRGESAGYAAFNVRHGPGEAGCWSRFGESVPRDLPMPEQLKRAAESGRRVPTIGHTVIYLRDDKDPTMGPNVAFAVVSYRALITAVHDFTRVNLDVFMEDSPPLPGDPPQNPLLRVTDVSHGTENRPQRWCWPDELPSGLATEFLVLSLDDVASRTPCQKCGSPHLWRELVGLNLGKTELRVCKACEESIMASPSPAPA